MRVAISTELAVSAERARAEVQTSRLLLYVRSPILAFEPIGALPFPSSTRTGNDGGERWSERAFLLNGSAGRRALAIGNRAA